MIALPGRIQIATIRVRIGGTEYETTDTRDGIARWLLDVILPQWVLPAPMTVVHWSGFKWAQVYTREDV